MQFLGSEELSLYQGLGAADKEADAVRLLADRLLFQFVNNFQLLCRFTLSRDPCTFHEAAETLVREECAGGRGSRREGTLLNNFS